MHSGPHSQLRRIYCPKGQAALVRWSHSYWYPPLAPPFALFRTPVLARRMNKFSHFRQRVAALQGKLKCAGQLLCADRKNNQVKPPKQRLPESQDEINKSGARLRVVLKERSGRQEIEVEGNKEGLAALAAICAGLARLTPDEQQTPANHYHLDEHFWGTEQGSTPLLIWRHDDGWQEEPR